jgi:CspA family cold shock protein
MNPVVEQVVGSTGKSTHPVVQHNTDVFCLSHEHNTGPQKLQSSKEQEGAPYMSERLTGVVKWFNSQKGYGFIERDGGPDVFVHYSAIVGSGYRNLVEGERVEFSIADGPKGPQASEVVRVGN